MNARRLCLLAGACLLSSGLATRGPQSATGGFGYSPTAAQRPRPGVVRRDVPVGVAAPDWRLKTAEGGTVALSELRGKVVVLDFWANWCGPCRRLEPLFDQLVSEYQSSGVRFFTLSIWPDRGFNAQAFLKEHKMASTFLVGDDATANEYGIWGVPTYYVIDQTGTVAYEHVLLSVDSNALGKRLREAIDKTLSRGNGRAASPSVPGGQRSSPRMFAR